MSVKVLAKYEACSDCLFYNEYGNHSEYDECFNNERWTERQAFIAERFERLFASHHVVSGDQTTDYSSRPCEVCGRNDYGERTELVEFDR